MLRDSTVVSIHSVVHHSALAHAGSVKGTLVLVLVKLLLLRGHDASANHAQGAGVFALSGLLLLVLIGLGIGQAFDGAASSHHLCIVQIMHLISSATFLDGVRTSVA